MSWHTDEWAEERKRGDNNLRPYLGNIFLVIFTECFNFATMIFTAYMRDDSKTNVQITENLPQCKKNRVRAN